MKESVCSTMRKKNQFKSRNHWRCLITSRVGSATGALAEIRPPWGLRALGEMLCVVLYKSNGAGRVFPQIIPPPSRRGISRSVETRQGVWHEPRTVCLSAETTWMSLREDERRGRTSKTWMAASRWTFRTCPDRLASPSQGRRPFSESLAKQIGLPLTCEAVGRWSVWACLPVQPGRRSLGSAEKKDAGGPMPHWCSGQDVVHLGGVGKTGGPGGGPCSSLSRVEPLYRLSPLIVPRRCARCQGRVLSGNWRTRQGENPGEDPLPTRGTEPVRACPRKSLAPGATRGLPLPLPGCPAAGRQACVRLSCPVPICCSETTVTVFP